MKTKDEIKQRIFELQEVVDRLEEEAIRREYPEYCSHTIVGNKHAIHTLKWAIDER